MRLTTPDVIEVCKIYLNQNKDVAEAVARCEALGCGRALHHRTSYRPLVAERHSFWPARAAVLRDRFRVNLWTHPFFQRVTRDPSEPVRRRAGLARCGDQWYRPSADRAPSRRYDGRRR